MNDMEVTGYCPQKSSDDQRLPGIAHRIIHMVIKASGYRNRYIGDFPGGAVIQDMKRHFRL